MPYPAKDQFGSKEEALEKAKVIGCYIDDESFHKMDIEGESFFMPCKTHEEYHEATGNGDKPKGHTPQHTVMQALGTIAEDMKDILKNLPKDENADLPSWWVEKVKNLAKDKVLEEIQELIEAIEQNSNKIHEAADVFYHLIMFLEANDVKIEEVIAELKKRQK